MAKYVLGNSETAPPERSLFIIRKIILWLQHLNNYQLFIYKMSEYS